jgi:uncharacterized membrane protein YdjX (TVP38/TMEM64 family)
MELFMFARFSGHRPTNDYIRGNSRVYELLVRYQRTFFFKGFIICIFIIFSRCKINNVFSDSQKKKKDFGFVECVGEIMFHFSSFIFGASTIDVLPLLQRAMIE